MNRTSLSQIRSLTSVLNSEVPKAKETFKDRLPALTASEVRRYRIPYDEAVVLEMTEENMPDAVEYLQFLFDLDEDMRKQAGPGTRVWNKPRLKGNRELIDLLRKVLTIFNDKAIPPENRVTALMETAGVIQTKGWEWHWVSEALYRTALWVAKEIPEDDSGQLITVLRYSYADFLHYKMKNPKGALDYIREAHNLSRHNRYWIVSSAPTNEHQSLYLRCCDLLHAVLLKIARVAREDHDLELCRDSCRVALGVAIEAGNDRHSAESLMELGKCEFAAKDFIGAIHNFYSCLELYEKICDPLHVCNVHSELAFSYKELGDSDKCLDHLKKLKDTAVAEKLSYKIAEAHYLIGEYYLTRNNSDEATPNLQIAASMYTRLGAKHEANRARCLTGVSKGQIIMDSYRKLILEIIEGVPDALLRLILWRDRGEPFDAISKKYHQAANVKAYVHEEKQKKGKKRTKKFFQ